MFEMSSKQCHTFYAGEKKKEKKELKTGKETRTRCLLLCLLVELQICTL